MKHLHFGAGSLGLGLICPLSAKAGNDVFVFNRRSEKEKNVILSQSHRYKLRRHNSTETEEVKISGFLDYNQIDDFLHYLREESEPILITTALKEYGLNDSLSEIHKILSGVSAKKYLIACENSISSDELFSMVQERFPEIAHEENNIQVVNSVVDRICNKIKIDRQQNIVLPVEDFGRWYIEGQHDDLNALFSTFLNDNCMAVTCHDIDLQKQRKKIMVNAVHQSIALLTHYRGMTRSGTETRVKEFMLPSVLASEVFVMA